MAHHRPWAADNRREVGRILRAAGVYSVLAAGADLAAWRTHGVVHAIVLVPAVVLTVVAGWCVLFWGVFLGIGLWALLSSRNLLAGVIFLGVAFGAVTGVSWWAVSGEVTLAWVSGCPMAVLVGVGFFLQLRWRRT